MKITILGSGSAYGCPNCFNDWGNIKDTNNPKNQRTRACTFVEIDGQSFLIDLTPDFREQINKNNIKNLDAVLLTHGHYDHIAAVSELWRAAHILQKKLNIFCSEETFAEVKTCFPYFFKSNHESGSDQIIWNVLQENQEFEFAGIKWQTFQNKHGHMSTTAYRHKNLAVVMDLEELSDTNKTRLHNLDLLIIECNNGQDDKARNGHNNLRNILNWTAELKPKKTLLTHLSTRVDYNEVSQTLPPEIELAYDGMIIEI